MSSLRNPVLLILTLLLGATAEAQLTAVFPPSVRPRAGVWLDQKRIFDFETSEQKLRPVWIHGGDSLSSGWSNRGSLRSKIAQGEFRAIPEPRSVEDTINSLPLPESTWYAGSKFNNAVLGRLEEKFGSEWVIVSSAVAGARLYPLPVRQISIGDPIDMMLKAKTPERVKLVTFSLGNNDVCEGNPMQDEANLRTRLRSIKTTYPNAVIVPFSVVPVRHVYKQIMDALKAEPQTTGRDRVIDYCEKMWSQVCPAALELNANVDGSVDPGSAEARVNQIYREELGEPFDAIGSVPGMNILDLLSTDCFHPSAVTEGRIVQPLMDHLSKTLKP